MNRRYSYTPISNLGGNNYYPINDPLTYSINSTIDQSFLHGSSAQSINGQQSKESQLFLSEYGANEWDDFCEIASKNTNTSYPNNFSLLATTKGGDTGIQKTAGDILIYNTAKRKYLKELINGHLEYFPFDPNVANSPLISNWKSNNLGSNNIIPTYAVNPKDIDNDIVMNKILENPVIAYDILINIYNTMKREKTLSQLRGTKLGNLFEYAIYFKSKGGLGLNKT
jgi:hypothetical protein